MEGGLTIWEFGEPEGGLGESLVFFFFGALFRIPEGLVGGPKTHIFSGCTAILEQIEYHL